MIRLHAHAIAATFHLHVMLMIADECIRRESQRRAVSKRVSLPGSGAVVVMSMMSLSSAFDVCVYGLVVTANVLRTS